MEWNEESIGRLRALWAEGHSTAEIGRRLGISKNAVVGKAHRLDLPSRPSPIRRDPSGVSAERRRLPPRRAAGPTLPPLTSAAVPAMPMAERTERPERAERLPRTEPAPRAEEGPRRPVQPLAAVPAAPRVQAPSRIYARTIACCWPIGEPGSKKFHFCCEDSVPGKPYCTEHAKLAYVRVRDRQEDAA